MDFYVVSFIDVGAVGWLFITRFENCVKTAPN